MRSAYVLRESVFSVRKPAGFVPAMHPLQLILERAGQAQARLDDSLVQMSAGIRSERSGVATGKSPRALRWLFDSRPRSAAHGVVAADDGHGICRRERGLIEQGFGKAGCVGPMHRAMGNSGAKADRVLCW